MRSKEYGFIRVQRIGLSSSSQAPRIKKPFVLWEGRSLPRQEVTVLSVGLSACLLVGRSVGRNQSIVISRKAVSKKGRKECILAGPDVSREGGRRLDKYR